MSRITKSFPGVIANDQISLTVEEGEIHALLGENGSGKTTLMNTLYGIYRPDSGKILLDHQEIKFESPSDEGLAVTCWFPAKGGDSESPLPRSRNSNFR